MKKSIKALVFISALCITAILITTCATLNEDSSESNHQYKTNQIESSEIVLNSNIVVRGISEDMGVFARPNLMNRASLFGKPYQNIEKKVQGNSGEIILKDINTSGLMEFCPSGDEKFYRTYIYVSPGDSVSFELKNKKIVFNGKNAVQNNLYMSLNENTTNYSKQNYQNDIHKYKETIKSIYEEKKQFVENYDRKYGLSKDFKNVFNEHLKFEYYLNLINPRSVKAYSFDMYFTKADCLKNFVEKESIEKEIVFNLTDYLDDFKIADFIASRETLNHSHYFKDCLNAFIRNYFETSDHPLYSKEKLIAEENYINEHLEGDLKEYAIGRMIWDYYDKGFAYNQDNRAYLLNLIDNYSNTVRDKKSYIAKMEEIKEDILMYDFELSESALYAKMVNHLGDTITLNDIFNRSNKRLKVVDFWASWCPPCTKQIKENKPFKDRLSVENNVEFIYLSIDTDKEKWLAKSKELSETLHFRNSYLLVKGNKSALAKALQVHQIPRYVVFGTDNKVIMHSAPSPAKEEVFERMIDELQPHAPIQ